MLPHPRSSAFICVHLRSSAAKFCLPWRPPRPWRLDPPMQLTFPTRPPLSLHRPRIVGVLNVTPDSFSDGGEHTTVDAAVAHAAAMLREGADLIDIGGESSRPGAERVPPEEQLRRVVATIHAITTFESGTGILPVFDRRSKDPVTDAAPPLLSIDTTCAPVARRRPRRRRIHHQRHLRRPRRPGHPHPRRRARRADLPHAHAGHPRNHAARPPLRRCRGRGRGVPA